MGEGSALGATSPPRDARQVRSHNALTGALLALLEDRPFEQITVREITARAGTGYATFFRHFPDKESLLGAIATDQIRVLFDLTFPILFNADSLEATRALCRYVDGHRRLWRALINGGAGAIVRREFIREAREWSSRGSSLAAGTPEGLPRDLAVVHGAGSTIDLLAWWLRHPQALTADQFAAVLDRLVITPLVGGMPRPSPADAGKLAAVVLAAGRGERFGGGKLLAPFQGRPLIAHALDIARSAPVARVVLVAGDSLPAFADVERLAPGGPLLSDSLKAGIAAAATCAGALVFLGDMPLVPRDLAARLVAALGRAPAALPTCNGVIGHPVLIAAVLFPLVATLTGDRGLGPLLASRADVVRLPVDAPGVLADVDTPADLAALARNQR